jgi:hypothetical protein
MLEASSLLELVFGATEKPRQVQLTANAAPVHAKNTASIEPFGTTEEPRPQSPRHPLDPAQMALANMES